MTRAIGKLWDAEMVRLYTAEGLGAKAIAPRVGCSHVTVLKRLRALGVEIRPAHRPRIGDYRLPRNRAMIASDMMVAAIGRAHPERIRS